MKQYMWGIGLVEGVGGVEVKGDERWRREEEVEM